jgi:hypothetical protein
MNDLTVLYYTANVLRDPFATKVRDVLLEAIGDTPLISISQKPLDFGENIVVDFPRSITSIYRQVLVGAKAAKTKYVAMAEDDCLYSKEHFDFNPPVDDGFWYDMARWSIYSWSNPPIYSIKYRHSNSTMMCSRELLISALEERFAKYPDNSTIPERYFAEPGRYEKRLGVTVQKIYEYTSTCPCVTFSHPEALGFNYQGNRKGLGELKAFDIPFWGKAEEVIKKYYE